MQRGKHGHKEGQAGQLPGRAPAAMVAPQLSAACQVWLQLGCLVIALRGVDVALDWGILLCGCHRVVMLSLCRG